jgi:hypothetical protein
MPVEKDTASQWTHTHGPFGHPEDTVEIVAGSQWYAFFPSEVIRVRLRERGERHREGKLTHRESEQQCE